MKIKALHSIANQSIMQFEHPIRGHIELASTDMHHEGWMVSDKETVLCWVSIPLLTMVVSSVVFSFHSLPTNNPKSNYK
jgi:hypothetical protein